MRWEGPPAAKPVTMVGCAPDSVDPKLGTMDGWVLPGVAPMTACWLGERYEGAVRTAASTERGGRSAERRDSTRASMPPAGVSSAREE